MKKLMALAFAILLIISTSSCGQRSLVVNHKQSVDSTQLPSEESATASVQQSNNGFITQLPTFTEARINTTGSEWTIQVDSYEISGDLIYIQGSQGINVLVFKANCILVNYSDVPPLSANQKNTDESMPLPSEESATVSCQLSNSGFKTQLPTFTEARINDGGSDWSIEVESYEISGDMIYIQGSQGINVLVSLSNCTLVDYSDTPPLSRPEIADESTQLPSEESATSTKIETDVTKQFSEDPTVTRATATLTDIPTDDSTEAATSLIG